MEYKTRALILIRKEDEISEKVRILKNLQEDFDRLKEDLKTKSESLKKKVEDYRKTREKFQKDIWKEKGVSWCQMCNQEFHLSQTQLFYTRGIKEDDRYVRRIVRFCKDCAQIISNKIRLGEDQFECFDAKEEKGIFYIFKEGDWQQILCMEKVIVQIERNNIPENDFELGKSFEFLDYPKLVFKVNGEDIFAKKEV